MIIVFISGNLTYTLLSGICIFAAREAKEGMLFGSKCYYNREVVSFSSLLFSSLLFTSYPPIYGKKKKHGSIQTI